jgi:hypothetical protein
MFDIELHIDYIRHGHSCANTLHMLQYGKSEQSLKLTEKDKDVIRRDRNMMTKDSILSNLGIKQSEDLGNNFGDRINNYDMVFCSELRRTMETALHSLKMVDKIYNYENIHDKIYILPYISEIELSDDNMKKDYMTVDNYMKDNYNSEKYRKLSYEIFDILIGDKNKMTEVNHNLLYTKIIPIIIKKLSQKITKKNIKDKNSLVFNIAIYTHSGYIREHFNLIQNDYSNLKNILNIFDPKLFSDHNNIKEYVTEKGYPYNTNIYTELLMIRHNNKKYSIGTRVSMKQIKLKNQNVKRSIEYDEYKDGDLERCVMENNTYKTYINY